MGADCRRRGTCRLCGSARLEMVLSLAPTPPANAFVPDSARAQPQDRYPLDVHFCEECGHVQLLDVVDPRLLFEHYVYVSGTSPVFVKHFEDYAADVLAAHPVAAGGLVVEIGSNDGTLLRFFQRAGCRVLGIDPAAEIAAAATAQGVETLNGFFTPETAAGILAERGPAAVVCANNVLAHIDDLSAVIEGVSALLAPGGILVFEVSYLVDVYENVLFDTIYHEHLDYHTVKPLVPFLARHGLDLVDARRVPSHGGSIRLTARKRDGRAVAASPAVAECIALEARLGLDRAETLRAFGGRIAAIGRDLTEVLAGFKAEGKRIAGFGAPAKATTLMYQFGIGPDVIDFIVDDSPLKQGLYSPGLHIPVLPSHAIAERRPDVLVVLAWNFAQPIMAKNAAFREAGGRFVVPLPHVEVI
jgi:SAM-dependent methyltransferase